MNAIFFLLPLLISISVPSIFAETGYDYFLTDNGDGTKTFISHEPYIFDGNNWVPFINTGLTTDTNYGKVTLNNDGSYTYYYKMGSPLFTDKIVAKYADITDLNTWTYPNTLNNAVPQVSWNGNEFVSSKTKSGIGLLEYKYIATGSSWKTQLEATNLSSLNTKVFGFDQIIDLNRDTIKFGGITRNLDNFNGMTFDRQWLTSGNNQGKILEMLNGINFDFDLGFDNLYSITVYDTGANKSQLVFDYRGAAVLLPGEKIIIDPTYSPTVTTDGAVLDNDGDNVCNSASGGKTSASYDNVGLEALASGSECWRSFFDFDTTAIPDYAIIIDVDFSFDVKNISGTARTCDVVSMGTTRASDTATAIFNAISSGTVYANNNAECATVGTNKLVDLGTQADTDLQNKLVDNYFTIGMKLDNEVLDTSNHVNQIGSLSTGTPTPYPTLIITYTATPPPDAVDDLTSPSQSYGTVDLAWTQPELNTGNVIGYQINYTTPYGNPLTIITNNTGTSTTSTSVTGLGTGTPYTFGVSVWTEGGNNATHPPMKWYNITTGGNFTIGTATFNQTNPFVLPITFEEQTINGTAEFLNVTFSNTFNLACDFHYKFANTNQTYTNLTSYAVSSTLDETSFVFTNGTNEIIDVYCWDQITDTNARYLLKQTDFPILDQILGFRSGDYGTEGMFGVFDLVTLLVIIGSMIGLNRENESVGIVFNVMLMFSLSFFGIIELTTVIFGMIALVLVFVITSTKKS